MPVLFDLKRKYRDKKLFNGLLAQLVARFLDMEEVTGSSPVETTSFYNTGIPVYKLTGIHEFLLVPG